MSVKVAEKIMSKELSKKDERDNPLAKVEELEEDNYNMIDGIPNNGFGNKKQKEGFQSTFDKLKEDYNTKKMKEAKLLKRVQGQNKKYDQSREDN